MEDEWNEKSFQKWLDLRTQFGEYKKTKDWQNLISVCNDIIELDKKAKSIRIMTPLFYKAMASSYEKLEDKESALKYYQLSKEGFIKYRNENKLSDPNDWLNDISRIDSKISRLLQKSK